MIKVGYTNDFGYHTKLVNDETTVKQFCQENGVRVTASSMVIVGGETLRGDSLNTRLAEYANEDGAVDIAVTSKQDNATIA